MEKGYVIETLLIDGVLHKKHFYAPEASIRCLVDLGN